MNDVVGKRVLPHWPDVLNPISPGDLDLAHDLFSLLRVGELDRCAVEDLGAHVGTQGGAVEATNKRARVLKAS